MLILVVHNSSHHADNVLRLGEEIARIDPHTNLVVLCERKDFERLTKIISNPETRIFALGQNEGDLNKGILTTNFLNLFNIYVSLKKSIKGKSRLIDRVFNIIEYTTIACLVREHKIKLHFRAQVREVHRLFEELSPSVVLSWGDRHIDLEASVLMAAKQKNIKVLLPHVTFTSFRGSLWSRRKFGEPKRWTPFSV